MDTPGRPKTGNGLNIGVYGDRMDGYGRLWTRMDEVKMGCVRIPPDQYLYELSILSARAMSCLPADLPVKLATFGGRARTVQTWGNYQG